jgi:hypothetical protein
LKIWLDRCVRDVFKWHIRIGLFADVSP